MPADAVLVFNDWHQNFVKDVGPRLPECVISFAPASHQANLAGERYVWGRQTDGNDVVLVEDRPVQVQQGHVEPVGLSQHVPGVGEVSVQGNNYNYSSGDRPEIWMNNNVINFEGLRAQGFLLPVLGVVLPQDDGDLVQLGPVDAVGSRGDVPVVEKDPATLVGADTNMSLPRELRELGLLSADDPLGEMSVT